jgi:CHAT domain-containing protein
VHHDPQAAFDQAKQMFRHGEIAEAARVADKNYRELRGVSTEWAWKFLLLEAKALEWQGKNKDALALLNAEPSPTPAGELVVQRLVLEGTADASLANSLESDKKLAKAELLCGNIDFKACSDVTSVRGSQEMQRGHFATAQTYFEHDLALARARGDRSLEAYAYLSLSWAADEQTHFDEALDWANAAHEISAAQGFADMDQNALGNMAWAYYKLGDTEKAQSLFVEAGKQAEKLGDLTDQVKWLTNAGYTYMDARALDIAEQSFQQSLKLAQRINSPEDIINSLIALAFVSEQMGKLDDAKHYANEALSMARADGNKRDQVYPRLVQGQVAARQRDTTTAESAFREVARSTDSPIFLKWEAERSLAHLYEDENQPAAADKEYQAALTTFETARSELQHEDSRLPFLSNASRIYDDYIHFLVARGKTDQALQVAEYSRARTLAEGLGLLNKGLLNKGLLHKDTTFYPDPLNAQQIARHAGGTILFYWLGEKQSYLWTITPQKIVLSTLPPASEIDAAVQRYRKALLGPLDILTSTNDGSALYRILIAPAEKLLPKDAKVFVVPDGTLNSLNFETLLVPEPKLHYWIEDATVADASSLRMLAAAHANSAKYEANLLLFGDADSPSNDYPQLSKAALEIENIQKHFSTQRYQTFTHQQATPPAYLTSQPEQFSYIHFVAHGTASRLRPLDSAIVLSKATTADDSFKLYARDIIQHPLRADLVTISTCYGAGARAYSGEGLVGLSWAFLHAGAHNVIGALWEVSDASTPLLMDELYAQLRKGKTPDAALRAAKLSLLSSSSAFRKPFYWAPFQLFTGL